jgi:uncharacterized SAM-binding protein YcdF (DUF218 family)
LAHARRIRPFLYLLLAFGLAWLVASVAVGLRIAHAAAGDPVVKADAIVVFGAAEYAGHPSPVLKARLDHALELFERGLAPVVITTGGAGLDPVYSEGGVGREYLIKNGVPDVNLIGETQANDTAQSADRVANIMHTNGMRSALVVSDAYHMFRIKQMMANEGVKAFAEPRPDSLPKSRWGRLLGITREVLSYWAWKLHIT